MAFVYVYSPSDFVGGLPDEQGAAAAGSGTFNLTLVAGATPTLIEIDDDDAVLDEVDYGQTLAGGVNIDGTSYGAGTTVHSAYDLINTSTGHKVTSLHFGGNGYGQGAVHGLVSTEPLVAGQSYTFNYERTSHRQSNEYSDFVACFVAGSRVSVPGGEIAVEHLQAGDQVITWDGALQPVRMVLTRRVSAQDLEANPKWRPVRITAGAMGQGLPRCDLLVSPQHRMLVSGASCERIFGDKEALVSALKLTALNGVYLDQDIEDVCYVHLVFDQHQILFAEGAPSESFYFGAQALRGLEKGTRDELLELFPELALSLGDYESVRPVPKASSQSDFVAHLRKKGHLPLSGPTE